MNEFGTLKWCDVDRKVPDTFSFFLVKQSKYRYMKLSGNSLLFCGLSPLICSDQTVKVNPYCKKKKKTLVDPILSLCFHSLFFMLSGMILIHTSQQSPRLCLDTAEGSKSSKTTLIGECGKSTVQVQLTVLNLGTLVQEVIYSKPPRGRAPVSSVALLIHIIFCVVTDSTQFFSTLT